MVNLSLSRLFILSIIASEQRMSISEIQLRLQEMRDYLHFLEGSPDRKYISQSLFHLKNYLFIDEIAPSLYQISESGKAYLELTNILLNMKGRPLKSPIKSPLNSPSKISPTIIPNKTEQITDVNPKNEESDETNEKIDELKKIWKWKANSEIKENCIDKAIKLAARSKNLTEEALELIFADLFGGLSRIPLKNKDRFGEAISDSLELLRREN